LPRALLSVSDKTGLPEFAFGLERLGFELYSTGGTLRALHEAGAKATSISELTGFPEILDGRVKTLHPAVHGGLLAKRGKPEHMAALREHGLGELDLLAVNLYPFIETASRAGADFDEVVEQIDIGGPAMIRSAAKNHADVLVVVRPDRYGAVLEALRAGEIPAELRRRLAAEAFAHTAAYDAAVSAWLGGDPGADWPEEIAFAGGLVQALRYGENPHQRAGFYRLHGTLGGLGDARQLQGGELSYNNLQDAGAAFALAAEFDSPAAAIIKHTNPCGCAVAESLEDAYRRAYECDTVSAYGGVVALNRECDAATAERIAAIFVEVVIAPGFSDDALAILARRAKVRVIAAAPARSLWRDLDFKSVPGGFLVQSPDRAAYDPWSARVVTRREPTDAEWEQLKFAWTVVKHVKSNAIALALESSAVGVGAGQMSRVEAVKLAIERAGSRALGSVMASDAFFPFADGVEAAIEAGITAIVQPGGSIRDAESITAADRAGVAMVMTGVRHFRH
jgi:phosphoribosylaminoimidazolecarboxamide formyltransferase / IMP cyclohydrolase